jgi:hypothetical protein
MIAGVAGFLIVTMRFLPDLPVSRMLSVWFVDEPAKWLASARRHHIVFVAIMMILLIAPETLIMLGTADLSIVTFALDVSVYIDAISALVVIGALSHVVVRWRIIRLIVARGRQPHLRIRRGRRVVRSRKRAANDPDHHLDRIAA